MLEKLRQEGMKKFAPDIPKISVGMGTCGIGNGADIVYESLQKEIKAKKAKIQLTIAGLLRILSGRNSSQLLCSRTAASYTS